MKNNLKQSILLVAISFLMLSCASDPVSAQEEKEKYSEVIPVFFEKIEKSDSEWRAILNDEEYRVLRESGTDRPFTGELWNNKKSGVYVCGGCGLELFDSETKFKSGTAWPSFYQPINEQNIGEKSDKSLGMTRTEVVCNRCEGHLGHLFPDGPKPTGLRYCINTAALDFVAKSTD